MKQNFDVEVERGNKDTKKDNLEILKSLLKSNNGMKLKTFAKFIYDSEQARILNITLKRQIEFYNVFNVAICIIFADFETIRYIYKKKMKKK